MTKFGGKITVKRCLCIVLLTIFLTGLLTGCFNPENENNTSDDVKLALKAYQSVLENESTMCVHHTGPDGETSIEEFSVIDLLSDGLSIYKYSIIDLNGDGTPEVVLWLQYGLVEVYSMSVLHYYQDKVYHYGFPYRGFYCLKADGTFHWSGGSAHHGTGRIDFDGEEYTTADLAYCINETSQSVSYFIGDESVSREDFDLFEVTQEQKQDTEWHEYTIDNFKKSVDLILSDFR